MRCRIERAAYRRDVAGDAGGGLVVHHHDTPDFVLLVSTERLLDAIRVCAGAPLLVLHDHVEAVTAGKLIPQMAKLAEARGEHLVAGYKRIGERRLPGAGAARWEDDDMPLFGLEDFLQPLIEGLGQLGKVGRTMIF